MNRKTLLLLIPIVIIVVGLTGRSYVGWTREADESRTVTSTDDWIESSEIVESSLVLSEGEIPRILFNGSSSSSSSSSSEEGFIPAKFAYVSVLAGKSGETNERTLLNLAGSFVKNRKQKEIIDFLKEDNIEDRRPLIVYSAMADPLDEDLLPFENLENSYFIDTVGGITIGRNEPISRDFVASDIIPLACGFALNVVFINPRYMLKAHPEAFENGFLVRNGEKGPYIVDDDSSVVIYAANCIRLSKKVEIGSLTAIEWIKPANLDETPGYLTDIQFVRFTHPAVSLIKYLSFNLPKKAYPSKRGETVVALLVPSTTRKLSPKKVEQLPIITNFMATFVERVRKEGITDYRFVMYFSYDPTDEFYSNEGHRRVLRAQVLQRAGSLNFDFKYIEPIGYESKPVWHWNIASLMAYFDGCDYMYQLNDDIKFKNGMVRSYLDALLDMKDVGIVGPRDPTHSRFILTQTFVHRTHIEIFGYYFAPFFLNWYCDDWVSAIYSTERTRKLSNVVIENGLVPRYRIAELSEQDDVIKEHLIYLEAVRGCERVKFFLNKELHDDMKCEIPENLLRRN